MIPRGKGGWGFIVTGALSFCNVLPGKSIDLNMGHYILIHSPFPLHQHHSWMSRISEWDMKVISGVWVLISISI